MIEYWDEDTYDEDDEDWVDDWFDQEYNSEEDVYG